MKIINFVEIENYQIITSIGNASPDPEETNNKVDAIIAENPDILLNKTKVELLVENIVFARLGQGQKYVDDDEGEKLEGIFYNLGSHEKLLLSGDTITDLRETEYWIKKAGVWEKNKIKCMGETLPQNAVLPDNLSQTQQQELKDQNEEARLANLTETQRDEEKGVALAAAKREVRYLKEEAEIAGEPFDAAVEYQSRKVKIEEKYG
jgi:predicted DNA binding CopG/RHH family protein